MRAIRDGKLSHERRADVPAQLAKRSGLETKRERRASAGPAQTLEASSSRR
jgi:hypothetical protein